MKRTKWFPASIKPVRKGVYERKYYWGVDYAYWNGSDWCASGETPGAAYCWRHLLSDFFLPWRGLTEPAA
jgi:hypothetical protein